MFAKTPGGHWQTRVNLPLWTALATTLFCALTYALHRSGTAEIPALRDWEQSSLDARFRLRGPRSPRSHRIVIVALDDRTRLELPELWQTRRGFANLIERVSAANPSQVAIDAFFSSPEQHLSAETVASVRSALRALGQAENPDATLERAANALRLVDAETRGDDVLAKAVDRAGNVILAMLFFLGDTAAPPGNREPELLAKARFPEFVFLDRSSAGPTPASGASLPLGPIAEGALALGHVNVQRDTDGAVRTLPLVLEHGGRYYQSLALQLAARELGVDPTFVQGERGVLLGGRKAATDAQGVARLSFLGPSETFPRVSAATIMNQDHPDERLRNKVVLIGYTDTARDKLPTPFEQQLDGVELHATALHNLLHGEFLQTATPWFGLGSVLILGALLTLAQLRRVRNRRAWLVGAVALACIALHALLSQMLFVRAQLAIDFVAPALSALLIAIASMSAALATEGRERVRLRTAFSQYVNENLVDRIIANPAQVRLGGERRDLTVLFSDIRGFSRFSETLEPEDLSDFLNEYLTPMTEVVLAEHGMLDKYVGDAVMAVYGAPLPLPAHPAHACRSALAMLEALQPLNRNWRERGLPAIEIGIGINSGTMAVGNMGSAARFDYTVMGDAVNLGARLEGLTKTYRVGVLVGEQTARQAGREFVFREVDSVRVVGRAAATRVFQLCGYRESSPFSQSDIERFEEALRLYRHRHWNEAEAAFSAFLRLHPNDGPAAVLRGRIASLREQALTSEWDGIYVQSSK